jgi:FKBP-type peptidyl-prolyl cis-trans isomerase
MKKLRSVGVYALILAAASIAVSCKKSGLSDAELLDKEQATLQQYLTSHNITTPARSSGLYYLPTDTGTGVHPDTINDVVLFSYTMRLLDGTVVATNIDSVAVANNLTTSGVFYRPFEYRVSWWFKGLKEGFHLMGEGGKATFIIPSELAYGSAGVPSLKIAGFTTVIFDIKLIKVIHDPIAYESTLIQKYISDSIPDGKVQDPLDSGVIHITNVPGTGVYPIEYQTVSVRYVARLIDGTFVESIAPGQLPFSFRLGIDIVIKGFSIGVMHMKKGESGWIIIPYKQAYSERPAYYVNMPPFTTLVYYVTIVDIQ